LLKELEETDSKETTLESTTTEKVTLTNDLDW
jgi:hypothetical protein